MSASKRLTALSGRFQQIGKEFSKLLPPCGQWAPQHNHHTYPAEEAGVKYPNRLVASCMKFKEPFNFLHGFTVRLKCYKENSY